ncbi:MAG: sigma-70 family RNA polymerase sigma factor [Actinobacteria bacterium]|nr:sigma-70 family RNA polymerase sigma factor [Actinomycetota bacterium]
MNDRRGRFEAVFREVYEPLQRYAHRRVDPATADDVVADALLVLWRRLDDIPAGQALPWSYGVARRCLANHRRSDHRQGQLIDRLMAEPDERVDAAREPDPVLEEALAELSADDREIVRLWAWEGLPPRDIAVVLDITPNAAAIRVHRAKSRLAEAVTRKSGGVPGHMLGGHAMPAHNTAGTHTQEQKEAP